MQRRVKQDLGSRVEASLALDVLERSAGNTR
jgi:hypothetical protein